MSGPSEPSLVTTEVLDAETHDSEECQADRSYEANQSRGNWVSERNPTNPPPFTTSTTTCATTTTFRWNGRFEGIWIIGHRRRVVEPLSYYNFFRSNLKKNRRDATAAGKLNWGSQRLPGLWQRVVTYLD